MLNGRARAKRIAQNQFVHFFPEFELKRTRELMLNMKSVLTGLICTGVNNLLTRNKSCKSLPYIDYSYAKL